MKRFVSLSTGMRIEYVEQGPAEGRRRAGDLSARGHRLLAFVRACFVIDHPDRVERLALMGAFSSFDDPGLADFVASSILPLTDPIAASFAREWQLSTLACPMSAAHLDAVVSETLKVPARVWRDAFDGFLKRRTSRASSRTSQCPCF